MNKDPIKKFEEFLITQGIIVKKADNLSKLVHLNYVSFSEGTFRKLVDTALAERDANNARGIADADLLGSWGVIIDAVKEETIVRKERALKNIQLLLQIASNDAKLTNMVNILIKEGHYDYNIRGLLREGSEESDVPPHMKTYILKIISVFEGSGSPPVVTPVMKSTTTSADTVELERLNIVEATETEDEDEVEEQKLLYRAGLYLRDVIAGCAGNARKLIEVVLRDYRDKKWEASHFLRVLDDNIAACEQAGYAVKLKILKFLRKELSDVVAADSVLEEAEESNISLNEGMEVLSVPAALQQLHAPQFIETGKSKDVSINTSDISCPESFINATVAAAGLLSSSLPNKKNKSAKRVLSNRLKGLAEKIENNLITTGLAVCDGFLPLDLVRRVRIEASLFQDHFEQSEIWVGSRADIGAQLSVPSVRGDKVLWVCGGKNHAAVEQTGMSRHVRGVGDFEPCKQLNVKADAPLRKFHALKELITACDGIIAELKSKASSFRNIFDRSDAMLAIYPGEGSRFANHIDNTTGDGRILTLLVYLNPDWDQSQGGALRVTGTDGNITDVYPIGGRLALFYSAKVAHEVLPTFGHRYAVTIWYYDREERTAAVTQAKALGTASGVEKAGIEAQVEAKDFIAELMGDDQIALDGGEPTAAELAALSARVHGLSDATLGIVASITGAPSVASFREGFTLLTPTDLKSMRALFRRMGLSA